MLFITEASLNVALASSHFKTRVLSFKTIIGGSVLSGYAGGMKKARQVVNIWSQYQYK